MYGSKETEVGSEVLSIRVPSGRVADLKKEARVRKVSMNIMVNHILDSYVEFQLYAKNGGFIPLPRKTARAMLNALREEEISILARGPLRSEFIDLVFLMKGRLALQSFLNALAIWSRESGFAVRDDYEDSHRTLTISHNMGKKWSILIEQFLTSALEDISVNFRIEPRDDLLIVRVKD